MAFKIDFTRDNSEKSFNEDKVAEPEILEEAKKSLVEVYFEKRNTTLSYYNDQFDLHRILSLQCNSYYH